MKAFAKRLSALLALLLLLSLASGCIVYPAQGTPTDGAATTHGSTLGTTPPVAEGSQFAVHFIDVGQADAILVICDGKTMLIDGGNVDDSNLIYSYLTKQSITHLDCVICTHAHEDHVGGLSGALTKASAGKVYSPVTTYNSKAFSNFVSKVTERGLSLTLPKSGEQFMLGSASVTVLGPLKDYDDPNNTSIVTRVVYGETSFLFTGDMESLAETDLLDAGLVQKTTVLKVGHHGSSSSTSYRFLRQVQPTYAVISVGKDNSYGHPTESVLSRLRDADVTLYRTDLQGDIVCVSDGKTLTFTTARNSDISTNPTTGETGSKDSAATEYAYIGNLSSKKLHKTTCSSLPGESNRIYFITKEEALALGYTACGICKP